VVALTNGNTLVITDNVKCNSITIPQPVTNILQINSPGPQGSAGTPSFLRNETNASSTDKITINQSIFNPSNLTILSSSIFIIEENADYYILGDLINSGSLIVSGTLKVGGIIYNNGSIIGPGIIE
jgi:hypothetical protein